MSSVANFLIDISGLKVRVPASKHIEALLTSTNDFISIRINAVYAYRKRGRNIVEIHSKHAGELIGKGGCNIRIIKTAIQKRIGVKIHNVNVIKMV